MDDLDEVTAPRKARIEIIPLIDVIFFLLATFVLFTLSLQQIKTIEVPLPKAGEVDRGPDMTLYIRALESGDFSWQVGRDAPAELVTAQEIPSRLENYKRSVPLPRVLVSGEGRAKLGAAVMVLDEARMAKISQLSIETIQTGRTP